jgi:RNA polymerase sigma factor (sigma-70 family)
MRSVKFSDSDFLKGLISRDERILRALYTTYFDGVRRFVLANNGSSDDAKDIFQDVLLVLFQKARDGNFKLTCALGTYLYSVTRFLWLKELSKRRWTSFELNEKHDFVDTDDDVVAIHEKNERLLFFRKCFEKLSENCRKVLSLYNEGHSIAEITLIMGFKSEQHTKNRRYRCKLTLIENIKAAYDINTNGYGNNAVD